MAADTFSFEITSPDGKSFSDEAEIINLRLTDGMIGILKGRLPLVGVIDITHMEYTKEGVKHYFALGGGILDVQKDHVLILADSFESKEEIDRERALEAKQRAEELLKKAKENPLSSNVDIKRANLALKRAMNRLTLLDN
jgi:F-type H+-transporting ATPase subunit epsilon